MLLAFALSVALAAEPNAPPRRAPPPRAAAAGPAAEAMRAAEAAFAAREDSARLAEAIARWREAAAATPGDPAPLLALARAEAYRALAAPAAARDAWRESSRAAEGALRLVAPAFAQALERGEDAARAAGQVGASGAEPLYSLSLAVMGMAQARGMAAVLAVKDAARAMMARAAELDERLDSGGPRRALGAWLATLPSAAGGGAAASRAQFERARALAPLCQLTRVREAQTLAVLIQDRQRFDALLQEVLAFDESRAPAIAPENRIAKQLARELLARRDRLF